MVKTAVILAAGMGSRLSELGLNKPKSFVEIGGISLIERSICNLIGSGIDNILIGVGHLSEEFNVLKDKYPMINLIKNDLYKETGSMYTLYNMRNSIKGDFLLLEADLLYDKSGIRTIKSLKQKDVMFSSDFTNSGDEVFIEVDNKFNLLKLSKDPSKLQSIYSELVGINKISIKTFKIMCKYMEKDIEKNKKLDYEKCLEIVSNKTEVFVYKEHGYIWCEIDNVSHLKRAKNVIYPRLKGGKVMKNILLNPGPANTTDRVKQAQIVKDICPREKEFGYVMEYVSKELTKIVGSNEDYTTILFGGSGTAGVEAAITSSVSKNDKLLIISNGKYGERMEEIAKAYDLDYDVYLSSAIKPIDFIKLEDKIKSSKYTHLAVVHNETTTGLLNDIKQIGKLCKKHGIYMIVDAMSSFGAIDIDMKEMNISLLISSSNKNLQGMAGVVFVIADRDYLLTLKNKVVKNYYLNLYKQYEKFSKTKQMRFTPPVQVIYALKEAIDELKEEGGVKKRYARYSKSWKTLIKGLDDLGIKHLVDESCHSRIITCIEEPKIDGYSFDKMHDYFKERGFTIYPGKLDDSNTFRIANIGAIDYKDIEEFLAVFEEFLGN